MFLLLFLLIPIIAAIALLFVKKEQAVNLIAIGSGLLTLASSVYILFNNIGNFDAVWLPVLNSRFLLQADGLSKILILLTAISFPAIFIATSKNQTSQKKKFLSSFSGLI